MDLFDLITHSISFLLGAGLAITYKNIKKKNTQKDNDLSENHVDQSHSVLGKNSNQAGRDITIKPQKP